MKFELGQVVMTNGIAEARRGKVTFNHVFNNEIHEALTKYKNCDWGITCEEDAEMNNKAIIEGKRILAVYPTCCGEIWIITEWDRSVTTILFPDEY